MRSSSVARTSLFILCLSILMVAPGRWARAADPGFQEPDLDFLEPEPDSSPMEFLTEEAGTCDGIGDGIWNGCRGTGCHVCQEKLVGYDCYFRNHPDCVKNTTCAGQFYSCDRACPPPTEADRCQTCDGIGDGIWNGCRGTGCLVCQEKLVGYDCYFQNHPACRLNTTCSGQFYSCDSACPPPTEADRCVPTGGCQRDTCGNCARPSMPLDQDIDGVPDTLEYDLAHRWFPAIMLQGFEDDLEESYFYQGLAMPYVVQPLAPRSICDEQYECLEVRYVLAYQEDTGDTIFGITGHAGDSEFYGALLQRTTSWDQAKNDPASWQMIRDFTAAHWTTSGDTSRYAAYGYCGPYCQGYDNWEEGCRAQGSYCSWFGGFCSGGSDENFMPCSWNSDEGSCFFAGGSCNWIDSRCSYRTNLPVCETASPVTSFRTLYAAEGKHGTYHSKFECDQGGFADADACPFNRYNLRSYKGQLLQNVGSLATRFSFDETVQHPNFCTLYYSWSGIKFAESTDFKHHFTYNFSWVLP